MTPAMVVVEEMTMAAFRRRRYVVDSTRTHLGEVAMLEAIPNYPQTFMDRHMNWHMGGRSVPKGDPGSGAEFLDFHHQFIADVKTWYSTQPGHVMSKLNAWQHFPADLVAAHPSLTTFEATASDGSTFTTEDALGIYIEAIHDSVHGWIATLYSQPEFGGFDSCMYFMFYQWHGMIDTWRGHWLTSHKSAVKDVVEHQKLVLRDHLRKSPKELVELPWQIDRGDPIAQLSQRITQLETQLHQQAFIRLTERPKVG
jgi:hypothetical protein